MAMQLERTTSTARTAAGIAMGRIVVADGHVIRRTFWLRCATGAVLMLLVWSFWFASGRPSGASASRVLIDFEDVQVAGTGSPFTIQGVVFEGGAVVDLSTDVPPHGDFAHSGTKAVETCTRTTEDSCRLTLEFGSGQARVGLWAGIVPPPFTVQSLRSAPSTRGPAVRAPPPNVELTAFDGGSARIATATDRITPATQPAPIGVHLEVTSPVGAIRRVEVGLVGDAFGILAVDDVEFEPAQPVLEIRPGLVDFGQAGGRADQRHTVTVESTGNVPVSIGALAFSGTDPSSFAAFDHGCVHETLPPKSSCTVDVQRLSDAATGPDAALLLSADTAVGRYTVRLVADAAPTKTTTTQPPNGGTAIGPTGGAGSDDTLRTVVIVVVVVAALAALGTAARLWMRPSAPLRVVVRPAPTTQDFGGNRWPTTVTVRFDPSTGTVEWTDRSRE